MTPKFAAAWSRYLFLLMALSLLPVGGSLRAEEVSREVPAFYTEKVEPLLTPLAKVLEKKDVFSAEDADGATLLNEQIDFVDEKGRSFSAGGARKSTCCRLVRSCRMAGRYPCSRMLCLSKARRIARIALFTTTREN